ncbi:hypothetical protein [Absidia glauca]|uniref:DNA-directed RNA polymerase III subunit RPC4 n=1 Tax=Absidia glauca TaxID=4829 RepID=A0A168KJT7_ABSGL|nr:hypothetical protein [Absidia glauca]
MSETPTNSTVKKQTRRFAPTLRGGSRGRSDRGTPGASESPAPAPAPAPAPTVSTEAPIGHIRSEPSEGRLQSIHGPKTRGGAAKMKFKPTIPTKRNKKEAVAIEEAPKAESSSGRGGFRGGHRGRGDGRGRGRGGRGGRGRGRGRGMVVEEVTASGIFSLGPSAMSSRGRSGMAGSGAATYGGDTSRTEVDDGTETDMGVLFAEANDGYTPVVFPHVPRLAGELDPADLTNPKAKIPWLTTTTSKPDKEDDMEAEVKSETMDQADDRSHSPLPPRETWMMDEDAPAQNIFAVNEKNKAVSVADDELLFFQLPAVVPMFKKPAGDEDDEMKDVKDEEEVDKVKAQLPLAAQKVSMEEQMAAMDLSDMPQGQIGKLVVLKSGKMKLKLGNVLLDIEQGMRSSFLENVMSVNTDTKKAVELGHIVQKFTCVPNMNALLKDHEEMGNGIYHGGDLGY